MTPTAPSTTLLDARARSNRLADPYVWLEAHILDALCELGRARPPRHRAWVETMCDLTSRTGMRELTVGRCCTPPPSATPGTPPRPHCSLPTSRTPLWIIFWRPPAASIFDDAATLLTPHGLIAHTDAGGQYLAIRYTHALHAVGAIASIGSVGSVGDSVDNALVESTIGQLKTELITRRGPCRTLEQLEFALLEYIDWWNHRRLHSEIGMRPPVEAEDDYYRQHRPLETAGSQ